MTVQRASDNPFPSVLMSEHVDPSNPAAGYQRLFVDTDHLFKMRDSAGTVTTFGAGLSDPMTTRGDLIVRNASNVTARLAIGSTGKVLSSDGTDVSWQTPSSGFSDPMTTRGDVIVRNSSNATARLAIGSSGKVLSSDGTDISWQTPSGGTTMIRGRVAANGTITSGSGFTITKGGTGLYQINWTVTWSALPLVIFSPIQTDNSSYSGAPMQLAGTSADTTSATGLYIREFGSATGRDLPWMFLAMEIV